MPMPISAGPRRAPRGTSGSGASQAEAPADTKQDDEQVMQVTNTPRAALAPTSRAALAPIYIGASVGAPVRGSNAGPAASSSSGAIGHIATEEHIAIKEQQISGDIRHIATE